MYQLFRCWKWSSAQLLMLFLICWCNYKKFLLRFKWMVIQNTRNISLPLHETWWIRLMCKLAFILWAVWLPLALYMYFALFSSMRTERLFKVFNSFGSLHSSFLWTSFWTWSAILLFVFTFDFSAYMAEHFLLDVLAPSRSHYFRPVALLF